MRQSTPIEKDSRALSGLENATVKPVVCILGMHRSGTSCLTGSLQQAGLHLGKYHSWNRYNQKGSRENQDIVDFHEELLAAHGASWDRPPERLRYSAADVERARALIERYRSDGLWGFKDARTLLALDLWREAARTLQCVGIFRHPRAVAESLIRRSAGRISLDDAMRLWLHYNRILYDAWSRDAFPMLNFDWEELRFTGQLRVVVDSLGLRAPDDGEPFYSSKLVHFQGKHWDGVPRRAIRLYEKLAETTDG